MLWNELLANLAIVALASSIWTSVYGAVARIRLVWQRLSLGLLMGVAIFLSMLLPFQFVPGVYLDLRYAIIGIASFFGGPVAAAIPVVIAVIRRLMLGGTGIWVAIPNITLAFAFGSTGYFFKRNAAPTVRAIAVLSGAIVASGTLGFFLMIPQARWLSMIADVVAPFGLILFVSTFLSCIAISQEIRRQSILRENWIYRAVIDALPDSLHAKDRDGRFIAANPAAAQLIAASDVGAIIGRTAIDFCTPETAVLIGMKENGVIQGQLSERYDEEIVRSNGDRFWLSSLRAPFFDTMGNVIGVITHNREITDKKLLELELVETQHHLTDALSSMIDGLALFNADDKLVFSNDRYLELFPLTADVRVPGSTLSKIISTSVQRNEIVMPEGRKETVGEIVDQLTADGGTREILMSDGRWLLARTRSTQTGGSMVMFSDVSKAKQDERTLREMNEKLYALAQTDGLTGLMNRRAFDRQLELTLNEAEATNSDLGLLMIDVDKFKIFNDTHGHPAGDHCLREVAACLTQVVSAFSSATIGRYGGEEFGIVLPKMNLSETESVGRLVMAAVRALGEGSADPISDVTVSLGGACRRRGIEARSHKSILERADAALYRAKAAGRDCIRMSGGKEVSGTVGAAV